MGAPELIWECVRKNNSFIRKTRIAGAPVMSAEQGNLCGLNSFKFSGLANSKVLGLSSKTTGKKESIVLTTRRKKEEQTTRPKTQLLETGVRKQDKKGLAAIAKAMDAGYYRRDLLDLATTKYGKIKKSFKKKKLVVKSRRASK